MTGVLGAFLEAMNLQAYPTVSTPWYQHRMGLSSRIHSFFFNC